MKKQAVIVIHGMGEQRPMGTLRSLVKAIWEWDTELHEASDERNDWWIKPDKRSGLQELRRITTGRMNAPGCGAHGKRTDFYEFYWADIMQGTTRQHVASWVRGLLFRMPYRVPTDALQVWLALWTMTVFTLLYATTKIINWNIWKPPNGATFQVCDPSNYFGCGFVERLLAPIIQFETDYSGHAFTALYLGVIGFIIYRMFKRRIFTLGRTGGSLVVFFLLGVVAYPILKGAVEYVGLLSLAIPVSAFFIHSFLVDNFGDVARYGRASPSNVEIRTRVRQRGMQLLTELHDSGEYDRIVIVSHSLGSIVAYDILSMFWADRGPKPSNGISSAALKKMNELDQWIHDAMFTADKTFDLQHYRASQRGISAELAKGYQPKSSGPNSSGPNSSGNEKLKKNWLITDLVTLGSPLTHAEFLMADDSQGIDKLISERVMPTCPPVMEYDKKLERGSFLYNSAKGRFPHHASVFSAVRWTNIYDHHPIALFGDVISGKVSENFGFGAETVAKSNNARGGTPPEAISECCVKIRGGFFNSRVFTHNGYWLWPKNTGSVNAPDYINVLRNAVNLRDELPDK